MIQWFHRWIFHDEIIKMGWLFHCNTGSLRMHKPSIPCSVLLENNYVIVKACSRNITGSTNLTNSEKVNLHVPVRLSFQSFFIPCQKKSTKCTYFATGRCFIHPSLIFATQNIIKSLHHIKFCISLLRQSLWTLFII